MKIKNHVFKFLFFIFIFNANTAFAEHISYCGFKRDTENKYTFLQFLNAMKDNGHTYSLNQYPEKLTRPRQLLNFELENSQCDVFSGGANLEYSARFLRVDIPLTRGLLGYRYFMVNNEQLENLASLSTLKEFKENLMIGSNTAKFKNDIFNYNNFNIMKSASGRAWLMLEGQRFNAIQRSIVGDISKREKSRPESSIYRNLMVYYHADLFFYVNKNRKDLHEILFNGLEKSYENNSFMNTFDNHPDIKQALNLLNNFEEKNIYLMQNPYLDADFHNISDKYWIPQKIKNSIKIKFNKESH
jgi:hypothetical protein